MSYHRKTSTDIRIQGDKVEYRHTESVSYSTPTGSTSRRSIEPSSSSSRRPSSSRTGPSGGGFIEELDSDMDRLSLRSGHPGSKGGSRLYLEDGRSTASSAKRDNRGSLYEEDMYERVHGLGSYAKRSESSRAGSIAADDDKRSYASGMTSASRRPSSSRYDDDGRSYASGMTAGSRRGSSSRVGSLMDDDARSYVSGASASTIRPLRGAEDGRSVVSSASRSSAARSSMSRRGSAFGGGSALDDIPESVVSSATARRGSRFDDGASQFSMASRRHGGAVAGSSYAGSVAGSRVGSVASRAGSSKIDKWLDSQ
ncbi:hypothetical protein BJX61DRAFT_544942 [Aspergillus egyptiacus]|nr:hypothetical protein BJX61DRAFT_544942 [Aspergillus egyptiacus]